jgi:HAMP domain-containing protein
MQSISEDEAVAASLPEAQQVAMPELAPVEELAEEDEAMAPAAEVTAPLPRPCTYVPPSPGDIVSHLLSTSRKLSPSGASVPLGIANGNFVLPSSNTSAFAPISITGSPATVRRQSANFSMDLISSITSPTKAKPVSNVDAGTALETIVDAVPPAAVAAAAPIEAMKNAPQGRSLFKTILMFAMFTLLIAAGGIAVLSFAPVASHIETAATVASSFSALPVDIVVPAVDTTSAPIIVIEEIAAPVEAEIVIPEPVIEEAAAPAAVELAPAVAAVDIIEPVEVAAELVETASAEPVVLAQAAIVEHATEQALEIKAAQVEEVAIAAPVEVAPATSAVIESVLADVETAVEPSEPAAVEDGEVVTQWSWSPAAVLEEEEDLFEVPFALQQQQQAGGAADIFALHAPIKIIVHAPLSQPATTEAEMIEQAVAEIAAAEIVPIPTVESAPMAAAEETASTVDIQLQAPSAIIEVVPAIEVAVIPEAAPVAIPAEPVVIAIPAEPATIVASPEVAPASPAVAAEVEAPVASKIDLSWRGTIAVVALVAAVIIGGLLQESADAAAAVSAKVAPAPAPASAVNVAASLAVSSASSSAASLASSKKNTSPFSFAAHAASAPVPSAGKAPIVMPPPSLAASTTAKRVSLSPIQPVRKIHFSSPDSADLKPLLSTASASASKLQLSVEPPTPGGGVFGDAMARRIEAASTSVASLRANMERKLAAADVPMIIGGISAAPPAAASATTLSVPSAAAAQLPESSPVPPTATKTRSLRAAKGAPTPAPATAQRRSVRLSMRV